MPEIKMSGIVGWEITAESLERQLSKSELNIIKVDSEGGSVFEANRMYNLIKDFLAKNPGMIRVEFGAIAASASSYWPLAVGKGNVSVRKNTTFMGHKAWLFTVGNSDDLFRDAKILDGLDHLIARAYSDFTGKEISILLQEMKDEIWLIGGDSIVEAGFADIVIDYSPESPAAIVNKNEILARIEQAKNRVKEAEMKEDLSKWAAKLSGSPNNRVNSFDDSAVLVDEEWDGDASEIRWRDHSGVTSSDDLPNEVYAKRFSWYDEESETNFGAYKLPIFDFKDSEGGEFVNVSAVRNALARLDQTTGISSSDKDRVRDILERYLEKYKEQEEQGNARISGKQIKSEEDMNLSEYLAKNPEAKKEFDEKFKSEAAAKVEADVKATTEKILKILDLSGIVLPEIVKASIAEGDSVADFALKEIENRKGDGKGKSANNLGGLKVDNKKKTAIDGAMDADEEARDSVKNYLGGKKK